MNPGVAEREQLECFRLIRFQEEGHPTGNEFSDLEDRFGGAFTFSGHGRDLK